MSHTELQLRHHSLEILCHEVRGTVAPLENWASLLHKHGLKAEDVEVLAGVLHRTVLVLSRLAGDLAALDEVTDAELAVRFAVFDLREAVSSVTHGVAPEAARKNIALNVALPDTPVPVFGDLVRLTQVVGNLLDNALKFTERPGSVSVELRSDGRSAELAVSDTGAGIAPEFLPLAFDKFMRAPVYDQDVARVATFIDRHYAEPLKVTISPRRWGSASSRSGASSAPPPACRFPSTSSASAWRGRRSCSSRPTAR